MGDSKNGMYRPIIISINLSRVLGTLQEVTLLTLYTIYLVVNKFCKFCVFNSRNLISTKLHFIEMGVAH